MSSLIGQIRNNNDIIAKAEKVDDPDALESSADILDEEEEQQEEEEEEESEYETDIEADSEEDDTKFDPTGRTRYLIKCKELGVVPNSSFLSNITSAICDLKHHSLGPKGSQAIARALIQNNYVTHLLMRDNAIQSEGSVYVTRLLREN